MLTETRGSSAAGGQLLPDGSQVVAGVARARDLAEGPAGADTTHSSPFCSASDALVQAFQSNKLKNPFSSPFCVPTVSVDTNPVAYNHSTELAAGGPKKLHSNLTLELISPHMNVQESLTPTSLECQSSYMGSCSSRGVAGCPAHGVKAVCGKRAKMEDTFVVQVNFFNIPTTPHGFSGAAPSMIVGTPAVSQPPSPCCQPDSLDPSFQASGLLSPQQKLDSPCSSDTLHFFGVYDGHGGIEAAQHCANRMHVHMAEALLAACSPNADWGNQQDSAPPLSADAVIYTTEHSEEDYQDAGDRAALVQRSGESAELPCGERPALESSLPGASTLSDCFEYTQCISLSPTDSCNVSSRVEDALRNAFLWTDTEFALDAMASTAGSTAVVAVLGNRKLWVANCGDSRAVLCRGGRAIQLTDDHKPEREDEAERVERAGGQVLFWNGHRVMGVLAMSRAIGDHGLRPYVIAEPEITVVDRYKDDEFVLLASDGLWDVMNNQEAVQLAKRCMTRAREKGASGKAAVRVAASVLTSAAIDRGSKDNVTVLIIDLKDRRGFTPVHDGLEVELDAARISPVCQHPVPAAR